MSKAFNILVVEDESIIAMAMGIMLGKAGHRVCAKASSCEDAIALARLHRPELILMDIRLEGDLDGIDAARKIREFLPSPIIFMSGYLDRSTRERAAALQPLAFLAKPVQLVDLDPLLSGLLKS